MPSQELSVTERVVIAFAALEDLGFATVAGEHANAKDAYASRGERTSDRPFLGFSESDLPDPDSESMALFHDLPNEATKSTAIDQLVDAGLEVDWDGSPELRIKVTSV